MRVEQAVLLVGGRGTRLGALSADTPKPLQEIKPGLRFLDLLLDQAARHGFLDIVLLAGHLGDKVEQAYQGKRVREATIRVLRETSPMGTGGAFQVARDQLAPHFLAANGDSFFDFNVRALTARPLGRSLGRLALRTVPDASRYGSVRLKGDRIEAFVEKAAAPAGPSLINGGVYLLDRDIIGSLDGAYSLEADVFPDVARQGRLQGMVFDGYFLDIGLPETLAQAQREAASLFVRPGAVLHRDSVLERDNITWRPGARRAIRRLNDLGCYVFVTAYGSADASGGLAQDGAHVDAFLNQEGDAALDAILAAWPIDAAGGFMIAGRDDDLDAVVAQAAERASLGKN